MQEDRRDILLDVEAYDGAAAVGYIVRGEDKAKVVRGGRQLVPVPREEREEPVYEALSACGVEFLTEQQKEDFPFYPVPSLAIFAVDGRGGCFAMVDGVGDLEQDCYRVVYTDGRTCALVASGLREFLRLVCFCPGWRAALDALRRGESAQDLAEPERGGRSRWAGCMAAERLGLTEEPHPLQRLEECVRQGAGVRLYASKAAAAAAYRLLER